MAEDLKLPLVFDPGQMCVAEADGSIVFSVADFDSEELRAVKPLVALANRCAEAERLLAKVAASESRKCNAECKKKHCCIKQIQAFLKEGKVS